MDVEYPDKCFTEIHFSQQPYEVVSINEGGPMGKWSKPLLQSPAHGGENWGLELLIFKSSPN